MTALLRHRGPDAEGVFAEEGVAIGNRRLAILDLSDEGRQPFATADGRLQLTHNGEIYNYRELRRELQAKGHHFRTGTDTEVILSAFREWGESCVERFNGMWAFALWDRDERRLFCSRDRFGVKPFYYRWDGTRLVFASELKAFAADPGTRLEPNLPVVRDYLEQAYTDHTDETFFRGIVRLPPAHSLSLDEGGLRTRRYWRLEPRETPAADAAEAVRELFVDSVRLRLRSDVPVGTCLSGGIDSSSVAVTVDHLLRTEHENAAPVGDRQRTFTVYFEQPAFDERPYAEAVVERTGADAHWVTFGAGELVSDLPEIVRSQDEPFGSTSICAGWYVLRAAKRAGLTVMLDGQGGDEVFAGYRAYLGFRLADLLAAGRLGELRDEIRGARTSHGAGAIAVALARPFAPDRVTRLVRARSRGSAGLLGSDVRTAEPAETPNGSVFSDRLRRHQELLLTRRGLPELLRYEDRNSMSHSIEARVPFLDYRLVELGFSLPPGEVIRRGRTKDVVRRALGDLLPDSVRERRDKLGFVTPEREWMRSGPLHDLAAETFASPSLRGRGLVDGAAALRRLERHRAGRVDAGMELWRAVNVELWAREFLDP